MAPHSTSRQLDEHTLPYMSYSQAHPFYAKSLYPAFRGVLNHWKWTASPAPHTTQVLARVSASDDVVFRRERRRFSIRCRLAGPESHWGHFRLVASLAVGNCRAWRQMGTLPMARSHRHSPVQTISLTASSSVCPSTTEYGPRFDPCGAAAESLTKRPLVSRCPLGAVGRGTWLSLK
jgi:hypothetical protein